MLQSLSLVLLLVVVPEPFSLLTVAHDQVRVHADLQAAVKAALLAQDPVGLGLETVATYYLGKLIELALAALPAVPYPCVVPC